VFQPTPTSGRLTLGLVLGLALALGAAAWSVARTGVREERLSDEQVAETLARGLASAVAPSGSTGPDGLEPRTVAPLVERFAEEHPEVTAARVLDLAGKRLVASTAPGDVAEKAAPRRLSLDEKPLYDLGQELRAAIEENRRLGREWKPEISARTADGRIQVAAPIFEGGPQSDRQAGGQGEVIGTVVLDLTVLERAADAGTSRTGTPWLAALLTLAVTLALFLGSAVGIPALRRHPGVQAVVATALFVAAVAAFWSWAAEHLPEEIPRGNLVGLAGWSGGFGLAVLLFVGLGVGARVRRALAVHRRAYLYVVPAMLSMLVLVFFPFFYGIILSFTNANIYNTDQPITDLWVGFGNFREILGDTDVVRDTPEGRVIDYSSFYWTLGFTIVWTVTNVTIGVSIGLLLALILHRKGFALKPVYRIILILPWAMPNYITALIWKGMFHSQFGTINQLIQILGGSPVSWFDTPFTAFLTVLSTNGWLSFPFMMVISLGALQSIPADLYEAARVDGASGVQQFRSITLPSLKPALVPAVIISVIWTFNMFNIIYLVSGGNPGGSTEILITEAYKIAFEQYRYGYAAAYSTVIFLILFAYGAWQNRVTRATEGL